MLLISVNYQQGNTMKTLAVAALALGALALTATPAKASNGYINSFSASATSVVEGTLVDFTVDFGVSTDGYTSGGSDPYEPAPIDGYQIWNINWYSFQSELVNAIWLSAGGDNSYADYPYVPSNSSYNGNWSFSVLFPTQGTFDITLSGGFTTYSEYYYSNESASRTCYNEDPGGTETLSCTWWEYFYEDGSEPLESFDTSFNSPTITIQVTAVPEAQSLVMALAGVGVLGGFSLLGRRLR